MLFSHASCNNSFDLTIKIIDMNRKIIIALLIAALPFAAEAQFSGILNKAKNKPTQREAEGKGETQPVADNKTKERKMLNRRVEFIKL
jgi:hypothetical protein